MSEAKPISGVGGQSPGQATITDYSPYMVGEALHEQSRKLDKLDEKLDRKFDKMTEDLAVIRERTAKIEGKIENIPDLSTRIRGLENLRWAIAGAIIVLSVLGNWLIRAYTAQ